MDRLLTSETLDNAVIGGLIGAGIWLLALLIGTLLNHLLKRRPWNDNVSFGYRLKRNLKDKTGYIFLLVGVIMGALAGAAANLII